MNYAIPLATDHLTADELRAACAEYQARRLEAAQNRYPNWTGRLHITPEIVDRILESDQEPQP
jgi:hypothetical protein